MHPPPDIDTATVLAVQVGKIEQQLVDQDRKLDAIHRSLQDDIARVEKQTTATNGTVRDHDRRLAMLKGALIAFGTASPFLVALMAWAMTRFLG